MPLENGVADFIVNDNNVWILEINPFQDYEGLGFYQNPKKI